MRNERARFNKRMKRERHGAASEVRHIERVDYQPPQPHVSVRPPSARQKQTKALLSFADTILLADAKRRHNGDLTIGICALSQSNTKGLF